MILLMGDLITTADGSPTPRISDITRSYQEEEFTGEPILCHYEFVPEINRHILLVYEGRHRVVAAHLAGREVIIGRLIGVDHPCVRYQHSPDKTNYFGKPIYSLQQFVELQKNNQFV